MIRVICAWCGCTIRHGILTRRYSRCVPCDAAWLAVVGTIDLQPVNMPPKFVPVPRHAGR